MFLPDLVIRCRRVVTPREVRPAAIHVRAGRIVGILDFDDVPSGCPVDEAGEAVVMPGVVDPHVHVSRSGRIERVDFETTTRAAATGGVTTLIDMPLHNSPATASVAALELKRGTAAGTCFVDVGFWGGLIPGNARQMQPLFDAGVFGFKCLLGRSSGEECRPVSESDLQTVMSESDLQTAMPGLARLGAPLLVHAELPGPIDAAAGRRRPASRWLPRLMDDWIGHRRYARYLESRPKAAENDAITLLIQLCRVHRTRTHVVHLSSSEALAGIFHARAARLPFTVETCPHYLYFAADEIPNGATEFKCEPPIRERANRELLLAALAGGVIQMVASDDMPPASTSPDFFRARGGITSLELSLAATWTAVRHLPCTLNQLAEWMCRAPGRLLNLDRKGAIEVGYDADFVIWDPDAEFAVDAAALDPRRAISPYLGRRLHGVVKRTYLRGMRVFDGSTVIGEPPRGRLLARV